VHGAPAARAQVNLCFGNARSEFLQFGICALPGNLPRQDFKLGRKRRVGQHRQAQSVLLRITRRARLAGCR
jgi:hypothetical protein